LPGVFGVDFGIGTPVVVAGAGPGGTALERASISAIVEYPSWYTITLSVAASTTVSNAAVTFNGTTNGAPYKTKMALSAAAQNFHQMMQ
jgi:hypothetical protein